MMRKFLLFPVLALLSLSGQADAYRLADLTIVYEDDYEGPTASWTYEMKRAWKGRWGMESRRDLTNVLSRVTGTVIRSVRESDFSASKGPVLYFGNTRAAKDAGIDVSKMKSWEYRIKTEKNRTFIAARTGMGASFGMTSFLETAADYFFMQVRPEEDPLVVDPGREAPLCDYLAKPAVPRPELYLGAMLVDSHTDLIPDYARRLCVTTFDRNLEGLYRLSQLVRPCHSFYCYCDPKLYFKDHPEYYGITPEGTPAQGKWNAWGNLCFTNPEVQTVVLTNMLNFIAQDRRDHPDDPPCVYDFTENDVTPFLCKCPNCKKVIDRYKSPVNNGCGEAGLLYEFLNPIARKVKEKYPDVVIRTFAYVASRGCPKDWAIEPESNILVRYCDLYAYSCHLLPLSHPSNKGAYGLFTEWAKHSRHFDVWDYMLYGDEYSGRFPEVAADAIAADLRLYRDVGMQTCFRENVNYQFQPFWEMHAFLQAQLLRNPDLDLEKLIARYCRVYGKGAPEMVRAIGVLRRIIAESPPRGWHGRCLPWRTQANMEVFRRLVAAAYAAERKGPARARIALVLSSVDRELARIYRISPGCGDAFDRAVKDLRQHELEALDTPGGVPCGMSEKSAERARLDREITTFSPTPVGKLPKELLARKRECVSVGLRDLYGVSNFYVKDPVSEVGGAIRFKDVKPPYSFGFSYAGGLRQRNGEWSVTPGPEAKDGKYHWYRLGEGTVVDPLMSMHLPKHQGLVTIPLRDYFLWGTFDDLLKSPNRYEFWASVRSADGDVYIDRYVLAHVVPPAK